MVWPRSCPPSSDIGRPIPHHIKTTQYFVDQIKSLKLQQGECMVSYKVKALFTSLPVDLAISIVKNKLPQDPLTFPVMPEKCILSLPW